MYLPCGLAATCLLNNGSILGHVSQLNFSARDYKLLKNYYIPECADVFVEGLKLENFVPETKTEEFRSMQKISANRSNFLPTISNSKKIQFYPTCVCSQDGTGFICPSTGFEEPKHQLIVTGDVLFDISGQNETKYYLYTMDSFRLRRYGGLSFGLELPEVPLDFGKGAPHLFRKFAVHFVAKIWYNSKGQQSFFLAKYGHIVPILLIIM